MKIILFNAPPDSGKDEAALTLSKLDGVPTLSFKRSLKAITLAMYGIPEMIWDTWYTREGKEQPREILDGLSCRQALIHVSEDIVKPAFGKSHFGKLEARFLQELGSGVAVVAYSDGGFPEEVYPLIDVVGKENLYIVRIHRDDRDFSNDSRNWIDISDIPDQNYYTIYNGGSLDTFKREVTDVYKHIMKQ